MGAIRANVPLSVRRASISRGAGGEAFMKRSILVLVLVLAAFPAHAISRYNSMGMSCAAARDRIAEEGAVILRYHSARHPNLALYDRYVSHGGMCALGQGAVVDSVPTRDNPHCVVLKCRDITYDFPGD
jgi:hypothetical protein